MYKEGDKVRLICDYATFEAGEEFTVYEVEGDDFESIIRCENEAGTKISCYKWRLEPVQKEEFYLVWGPGDIYNPTSRHTTFESAKTLAESLAKNNPGEMFYVMAPKGVAQSLTVEWTNF